MPATKAQIVFDAQANVQMIIVPDADGQLSDPAFNPPGTIVVSIPINGYQNAVQNTDVLTLCYGQVKSKNQAVSALLRQSIINQGGADPGP